MVRFLFGVLFFGGGVTCDSFCAFFVVRRAFSFVHLCVVFLAVLPLVLSK